MLTMPHFFAGPIYKNVLWGLAAINLEYFCAESSTHSSSNIEDRRPGFSGFVWHTSNVPSQLPLAPGVINTASRGAWNPCRPSINISVKNYVAFLQGISTNTPPADSLSYSLPTSTCGRRLPNVDFSGGRDQHISRQGWIETTSYPGMSTEVS